MKYVSPASRVFTRYDVYLEVRQTAFQISKDELLQKVADCLVQGKEDELENAVQECQIHKDPMVVITEGLFPGMKEVSRILEKGVYVLPQIIFSSDTMIKGFRPEAYGLKFLGSGK